MVNAKQKGNRGEKYFCDKFKKYIGGSFVRSRESGAYIGKTNAWRKETLSENQIRSMKGDIIPPDDLSKIVLECKWYKDFNWHVFAVGGSIKDLDTWISELEYDCDPEDIGFLCVKVNRRGDFIAFKKELSHNFTYENYVYYKGYIITELDSFLSKNSEKIKLLAQR